MPRGDDKIRMPASTAGITQYWDDVKTKVELTPQHIIILAILIIALELFLQLYGRSFFPRRVTSMLPGMNPRKMQQVMKQMGIQQQEIDADRVEIVCADRKIVIEPCQVAAVNMMGQKTWQVMGEAREESLDAAVEISDEDVQTVSEQAGVSEEKARAALEETKGDLAEAILKLQQ